MGILKGNKNVPSLGPYHSKINFKNKTNQTSKQTKPKNKTIKTSKSASAVFLHYVENSLWQEISKISKPQSLDIPVRQYLLIILLMATSASILGFGHYSTNFLPSAPSSIHHFWSLPRCFIFSPQRHALWKPSWVPAASGRNELSHSLCGDSSGTGRPAFWKSWNYGYRRKKETNSMCLFQNFK